MQIEAIKKVALVDDHRLFRKGMLELINGFAGYAVVWEAENGKEFTDTISPHNLPDVVLLDISMPVMDGFETARWMLQRYPEVKILALSMHNDDETILNILQAGVNGYVLKDADTTELEKALREVDNKGTYYSNRVTKVLIDNLNKKAPAEVPLSEREIEFLKLACTELPYKSFAPILKITPRLVEDTRAKLFEKLKVVSRVGLVIYAIKHKIFIVE